MKYTDETVPPHVPRSQAGRWAAVFNAAWAILEEDNKLSAAEMQARAARIANATLSNRSNRIQTGSPVAVMTRDGFRRKGKVTASYTEGEYSDDPAFTLTATAENPVYEVELYRNTGDAWVSRGTKVLVGAAGVVKIEDFTAVPAMTRYESPDGVAAIKNTEDDDAEITAPAARTLSVKRLGEWKIGGYAVVFGNESQRDLEGDWFTKATDFMLDYFKGQPIVLDHTKGIKPPTKGEKGDLQPRDYVLGRTIKAVVDDTGVWIEAVIDRYNDWASAVMQLVERGALHFSSGSAPHLIRRAGDSDHYQAQAGEIKSWPLIEISLTPSATEPRMTKVVPVKHIDDVEELAQEPLTDAEARKRIEQINKALQMKLALRMYQ